MAKNKRREQSSGSLLSRLDMDQQKKLGVQICQWVRADLQSRSEWEKRQDDAFKLWALEPPKRRLPWPDAANICVPMIASAVNNWAGLVYTSMFEQPYPERVQMLPTEPNDVARAERAKDYMNWQLIFEMGGEYEESYDSLLPDLAISGTTFKKVTWDQSIDAPRTQHVSGVDIIVPNDTRNLREARRTTHRYRMHLDDIRRVPEFENTEDLPSAAQVQENENTVRASEKARQGITEDPSSDDTPNVLLECHFRGEIDGLGDGAWIVTVDQGSSTPLRLEEQSPRIKTFFVDYHFIPSPIGEFYSYGFGHFLGPLNLIQNSIFNQYIDAGRISNSPFTFHGRGAGLRGRKVNIYPGGSAQVDDVSQILITKFPALDANLPLLINFIKEFGQDITANTDEMQGRAQRGVREPTVRGQAARIGRSLAKFGVFAKRVFRAQQRELQLIFDLNSVFLPENEGKQFRVLGSTQQAPFNKVSRQDFKSRFHLKPTANPDFASVDQRRAEAGEIMNVVMTMAQAGLIQDQTLINRTMRDWLATMGKADLTRYIPPDPPLKLDPHAEDQLMLDGEAVEPKAGENHAEHLRVHLSDLNSTIFANASDLAVQLLLTHIEATQLQAVVEKRMQEAQVGPGAPAQPQTGTAPPQAGTAPGPPIQGAGGF